MGLTRFGLDTRHPRADRCCTMMVDIYVSPMGIRLWELHDGALPLFRPRIVLLIRSVDERVVLLVFLNVFSHPEIKNNYC